MTTTVGTGYTRPADDAEFRANCLLFHQGIVSGGFDNCDCPNQIDFDTVTHTVTANQKLGFRIYKFTDALQATTPIYFRVDYGNGAYGVDPSWWITAGFAYEPSGSMYPSGSEYSGTISTGNPTLPERLAGYRNEVNVASCSFSGDGSQYAASLFYQAYWFDALFTIERTKDDEGNDDARGFLMSIFGGVPDGVSSQVKYISGSTSGIGVTIARNNKLSTIMGSLSPRRYSGSYGDITPVSPVVIDGEVSRQVVTAQVLDFSPFEYQDIFVEFPEGQIPFRVNGTNFGVAAYFSNAVTQHVAVRFQG